MTGMTFSTINACHWQYTKYKISVNKWQQVEHCLENQNFQNYSSFLAKLDKQSPDELEFSLLKLQGHFIRESLMPFARTCHNRFGYQLFAIFELASEEKVMVNVGWVEKDFDLESLVLPETEVEGVIRVARESKAASKKYLLKDGVNESICLQPTLDAHNMKPILVEQTQSEGEGELYPLRPTVQTFERPYLTPDKHRDYAIFWGTCTGIGFFSIASALI